MVLFAYTFSAAATPAPGVIFTPAPASTVSSAASTRNTLLGLLFTPISPIRHAFPLKSPSPPPISMPNSVSIRLRQARSSTPSGMRTAFNCGSWWAGSAVYFSPSASSPALRALWFRRCRSHRASSPSSSTIRSPSRRAYTMLIGPVWWYARSPPQ